MLSVEGNLTLDFLQITTKLVKTCSMHYVESIFPGSAQYHFSENVHQGVKLVRCNPEQLNFWQCWNVNFIFWSEYQLIELAPLECQLRFFGRSEECQPAIVRL